MNTTRTEKSSCVSSALSFKGRIYLSIDFLRIPGSLLPVYSPRACRRKHLKLLRAGTPWEQNSPESHGHRHMLHHIPAPVAPGDVAFLKDGLGLLFRWVASKEMNSHEKVIESLGLAYFLKKRKNACVGIVCCLEEVVHMRVNFWGANKMRRESGQVLSPSDTINLPISKANKPQASSEYFL